MADDAATAFLREAMPLCALVGARAELNSADSVVLSLDWKLELCTSAGILHGGVIMALADSAGAALAFANLPDGASGTSTIESKTNFLGAVNDGSITATATPLHLGTSTIVIETSVRDSSDRLIAKVTQTQAILRPRS